MCIVEEVIFDRCRFVFNGIDTVHELPGESMCSAPIANRTALQALDNLEQKIAIGIAWNLHWNWNQKGLSPSIVVRYSLRR